jgi:hypothetical protein
MPEGIGYALSDGGCGVLLYSGGGLLVTAQGVLPVDGKESLLPEDEETVLRLQFLPSNPQSQHFLAKYVKTSAGYLLKLSTGTFQMVFEDHSLVAGDVLGSCQNLVYIDKDGRRVTPEAGGQSFRKRLALMVSSLRKVLVKLTE